MSTFRRASALLLSCLLSACQKDLPAEGPVLARGDGVVVTAAQLRARVAHEQPLVRGSYASAERRRALLDDMVADAALAAAARRQGLDRDPDVVRAVDQVLGQALLERSRRALDLTSAPTTAELQAAYAAHQATLSQPEQVRAQVWFLAIPETSPLRAAAMADAQRLQQVAVALPGDEAGAAGFQGLVRQVAPDFLGAVSVGDLGLRSPEELRAQFPGPVAEAVLALPHPGACSPVVETPAGVEIVRLLARQAARQPSFEEVKPSLNNVVLRDRVEVDRQRLRQDAVKAAHPTLDEAALTGMSLDMPVAPEKSR